MKYRNAVVKYGRVIALGGSLASMSSFADTSTYAGIVSAANFQDVAASIVSIFALLVVAAVAMKGGSWVVKAVGGGR